MATCDERVRLGFLLPHMRIGGIEIVVSNILRHIDRDRFEPVLALKQMSGELLDTLPPDIEVHSLGEGRAAALMPTLRRFLTCQKLDVVYSATNAINLATLAAARSIPRASRPAVMISEHTSPSVYVAEAKWPALRVGAMRLLYPAANIIVTPIDSIGAELKRLLRQPGLPTLTLPNPIIETSAIADTHQLQECPKPGAGQYSEVRFVAAGRLVTAKAFDVLIRAFAVAVSSTPPSRLTIYGEGPTRPMLEELARSLGVGDRVALPGNVTNLVGHLGQHSIFVLSSRREGFGNVLIEAMAAGVPVVATDQAGPRAILQEGVVGLLVATDAPESMAEAMIRLAGRSDLRRAFTEAGFRRCRDFEIGAATREFERSVIDVGNAGSKRGAPFRDR
ncbi:glycosyltransferase [Mesorhizobium mediterraneum]|uniref:glycosyltransferase n=1 Tax=Mesorhizobium mediterraneum TaxID=43617 RepID=UPI0017867AD7|nr:glycosyltransferase [Mesorhizobium mediterraneum]